jgi:hypothetical protein
MTVNTRTYGNLYGFHVCFIKYLLLFPLVKGFLAEIMRDYHEYRCYQQLATFCGQLADSVFPDESAVQHGIS